MGVFVVKGKKGGPAGARELEALVVGARSTCSLSLEDPLVAETHCAFGGAAGAYYVEDLGTSTGTYVNGVAARGRTALNDGDDVVVGTSRLKVSLAADKPELTLTLKEADFYFDKKEDPLRWSKEELAFGEFAPLRYGNYAAIVALLIALPFCLFGGSSERAMDFGALACVHRTDSAAYARDAAGLGPESQGCAACHDPYSGATVGKCAACHGEILAADRHPFATGPAAWSGSCAPCHAEHRGEDAAKLRGAASPASCKGCHAPELQGVLDAGTLDMAQLGSRLVARRGGRAATVATFETDVGYETFSHKDHVGAGVACGDCHAPAATPIAGGARSPRREFGFVAFETCQKCHAPGTAPHPRAPKDAAGAPAKRFTTRWHGTDDGGGRCRECHVDVGAKELRTSEVADVDLTFSLTSRAHAAEAAAFGSGKGACAECHPRGAPEPRALAGRPFRHGTHCAETTPKTPADAARLSAACAECHREQRDAPTLAATTTDGLYAGARSDCTPCHGVAGAPSLPRAERATKGATRRRVEFPHAKHLGPLGEGADAGAASLKEACFACHEFRAGEAGAFDASVRTKSSAADCRACHESHRDLGGGACAECHKPGDAVYAARTDVRSTVVKAWPKPAGFSHFSSGHRGQTESGRCGDCHRGAAAVDGATTVSAVAIPGEDDPSCRQCHIRQGARFHWR